MVMARSRRVVQLQNPSVNLCDSLQPVWNLMQFIGISLDPAINSNNYFAISFSCFMLLANFALNSSIIYFNITKLKEGHSLIICNLSLKLASQLILILGVHLTLLVIRMKTWKNLWKKINKTERTIHLNYANCQKLRQISKAGVCYTTMVIYSLTKITWINFKWQFCC